MSVAEYFLKRFMVLSVKRTTLPIFSGGSAFALMACSGGSGGSNANLEGFPSSFTAPKSDYFAPTDRDINFEILKPDYVDPYWVAALEMDQPDVLITPMLQNFNRTIHYTFPDVQPEYDHFIITGWEPASDKMRVATREILLELEKLLDVKFREVIDANATNVISVSMSKQDTTSGISFFPNNFYEIGMDVFIAKGYENPSFESELITNFDYEVLVHELGHALGMKHPFEASGANSAILPSNEDKTGNTAMSYNDDPLTFDGKLRPLDWMTLTKFYGVKSTYNAGDDIYEFSGQGGTFIIDGSGFDTIKANNSFLDVMIDLRPGSHSYIGNKSTYITSANQLTISHGTYIENVETGPGDDTVIGTELNNVILTGGGADTIFAGGGADIIKSGSGADRIDLSETVQCRDTVMLEAPSKELDFDTIFGFVQGTLGDILDVTKILSTAPKIFPLVESGSAPVANFSNGVLRLIGSDVTSAADLVKAFDEEGSIESLTMSEGARALIISAENQTTGADQCIFGAENRDSEILVAQLAVLQGNALDIDQWHVDNFYFTA